MKMRRLELAILAITLAFAFFMGGFFTGRSHSAVSFAATTLQAPQTQAPGILQPEPREAQNDPPAARPPEESPAPGSAAGAAGTPLPPQAHEGGGHEQGTGAPKESDGRININTASHGELTDLPGIGNTLASRIIDYRTQNGSFAKTEDIRNVSGIGEKRYEAIMDLITVG